MRMAVCDKTFRLLQQEPYAGMFESISPREEIPLESAQPFNCRRAAVRHPRQTKGLDYDVTIEPPGTACSGESCC
jgi:hypothetical protein